MISFNCTLFKNATLPIGSTTNIGQYNNAAQGKLTLNGSIVESNGTVNFDKNNFSSSLSITSVADLTAIVFTIKGYNNNLYVTEIINGPNNATVNTNNLFTKILEVSISADIIVGFNLGTNGNIAVRLVIPSDIGTYSSNIAYFALRSRGAGANGWLANEASVYVNLTSESPLLLANNLLYANATNNYFLLAGGSAAITQANLQKGFTGNISVVASELICFLPPGVARNTESFIQLGFRMV